MGHNKWEGRPRPMTAESERDLSRFDDNMLSVEALRTVEQKLFADPKDEPAIRLLSCQVRIIGERLIALEEEFNRMSNSAFPK